MSPASQRDGIIRGERPSRSHFVPSAGEGCGRPSGRGGIMVYRGTIKGGVVVLPADVTLPDGTEVLVALPDQWAGSESGRAALRGSTEFSRRAGMSPTEWPPYPAGSPTP